ncbi:MAG: pyruvate ferredoxin oxidoreductase, partial [Methanophagales archaeon]|nr:pyruvate ferredoxin oxidoreductase [Methanophagales archaeon]
VTEYLKKQGRFKHLNDDTIATIQTRVEEDYVKLREKAGVK